MFGKNPRHAFVMLALAMSVSSLLCAPTNSLAQPDNVSTAAISSEPKKNQYPIFFVTNRQENDQSGKPEFGTHRAHSLSYGMIPVGSGTQPKSKIDHSAIRMFRDKDEFYQAIKQTGSKKVGVFVHGYRKSFDGSIDLGRKLETNLDIPVIVFAWPSKNKYSAYMGDEATAEWSSFPLSHFFTDLADQFEKKNISIISHSLGGRMVAWSLRINASENKGSALSDKWSSIVFCSPDFDRDTFIEESKLIRASSEKVKIYLDSHDTRIWLSKVLHGNPRLGSKDETEESHAFLQVFDCDFSLPSHHIPFPLLTADGYDKESKSSRH